MSNNWGRFGADDERGMLNLLTPDVVLAATFLVSYLIVSWARARVDVE